MENRKRLMILMSPPAIWLFLLFLLPLGIMVIYSFRAATFGPQREIFTLESYQSFISNTGFQRLLLRSTWWALLVSVFAVILAYPLAYFLSFHSGRLKLTLLTVCILPAFTSYLLRVLAWKVILGSSGLLNSFLVWIGLIDQGLPILLYSSNAVMVALTYVWIPWVALPIFAALEGIDRSLLEAAQDLFCTPFQTFVRVTLPLSLPGVIAGFFFVFIPTVGEYVTPMLLGGASGIMYGNMIQDQFAHSLNWPLGSVLSLVMLIVVLFLIFIFVRLVRLGDLINL